MILRLGVGVLGLAAAAFGIEKILNKKQKKVLGVIISGAPGSGKGTQCEKIKEKYGLIHISVGDLLRAEVSAGSEIGKRAKSYMDAGKLVPDEVVVDMVAERLQQKDIQQHGFLLDGFPRTAVQAEALKAKGIDAPIVVPAPLETTTVEGPAPVSIDAPEEMLTLLVGGRR
eukprot:TRINITY_DN157_c0_g2_i6.p3 TRINITY_DN157_c0_g2~~TRINITY_DN157_c0_g2_i6.p3  ORF type:complete len:171 (+),score=48.38 TRINITY_DN157_c0_g2_i6:143-655(+)